MRYTVKELKTMSVKELVKILVKSSMSTNKSSKQLEKAILNIFAERESAEYNRMMQSTEENEWDWIIVLFRKESGIMEKYSITGHSKLIDESENLWGFVVEDNDNNETLLSDDYFSSSIVAALDEISIFLGKPDIKEGQRVRITIETE